MKKLESSTVTKIVELWRITNKTEVTTDEIEKLVSILGKLGYQIEPESNEKEKFALSQKNQLKLTGFIKKFVVTKVKHPKGVAGAFPCDELAAQILLDFEVKD